MPATAKIIYFRATDKQADYIDIVREKLGLLNNSEVLRLAVMEIYARYCEGNVRPDPTRAQFSKGRPTKETKEERKIADAMRICRELGGTVVEEGGAKICHYNMYEKVSSVRVEKYEQGVSLGLVTASLIDTQYKPSKVECLAILNKKK